MRRRVKPLDPQTKAVWHAHLLLRMLVVSREQGDPPCACKVNCAVKGQEFIICLCPKHAMELWYDPRP